MNQKIEDEIIRLNLNLKMAGHNYGARKLRGLGYGLVATKSIHTGRMIIDDQFVLQTHRDLHSIEIDGRHFYHPIAKFLTHSCQPNCFFVARYRQFYSFSPIRFGDVLTFDYKTTETKLSNPFDCKCKSDKCRGYII